MKITVKLIGFLIYHAGFGEKEVEVPYSTTAEQLLPLINIKKSFAKIVLRNGKSISFSEPLKDGDRIVISPLFSGG
ncbi:MAG: MoaD/ThiS family protein [Candidatus Aminicenantes bacterium]|nr:MoaD/ThiS family protein [Candidatus Aminicenantes bacterium]